MISCPWCRKLCPDNSEQAEWVRRENRCLACRPPFDMPPHNEIAAVAAQVAVRRDESRQRITDIAAILRREADNIERGYRHEPNRVGWDGAADEDRAAIEELRWAAEWLEGLNHV